MASDLTPELTEKDWDILRDFRLSRIRDTFPCLETCKLQLSSLTNDLLLICDRPTWNDLQDDLIDVRMASWDIVGACNLSVFADGHLVYCAMTQLSETLAAIEPTLESTALRLDSSMANAATKDRPVETSTPTGILATDAKVSTLPEFIDLMPLAQKAGLPVDRIAAEINQLGGVAGVDRTGAYITTDKDQRAWVKAYLQRLEAEFLLPEKTTPASTEQTPPQRAKRSHADASQRNGKATATAEPAVLEPAVLEPAAIKEPKKLNDFKKAQGYAVTIGRFLEAQGWSEDNPLRAQVFEGIAALPDDFIPMTKGNSLPERALRKILSKYPENSQTVVCRSLIKVARETIGNPVSNVETALESTEV